MDAIYGYIGKKDVTKTMDYISQLFQNRGKNSEIFQVDGNGVFGSNYNFQVQFFENNNYAIVCNSRIYNREQLLNKYKKLQSVEYTRNEVLILSLFEHFGSSSLKEINGDYTFAIYDKINEESILFRNYLGSRSLFITKLNHGIAFATEYKAFLEFDDFDREIDFDMIQHLHYTKKMPVSNTLFKDVKQLKPGTIYKYNKFGKLISEEKLKGLNLNIQFDDEKKAAYLLKNTLLKSVERRTKDLETIGVALSGGIDSIALVCMCRHLYPDKTIHTFSCGYGSDDEELKVAERVAKRMGAVHHVIETPPNIVNEELNKIVWALEDPIGRSEILQQLKLAQEAKKHVDVVFTGQGVDGLFAGMPKYKILWLMKLFPMFRTGLAEFFNYTQVNIEPKSIIGKIIKFAYYKGKVSEIHHINRTDYIPNKYELDITTDEAINKVLVKGYQDGLSMSLQKFEKIYAAEGVEYRSAYYDPELINIAFSITDSLKIKNGIQKYILRKAVEEFVPKEFLKIPKHPQRMNYDLEFSKILENVFDKYLKKEKVDSRAIFDYQELEKLKLKRKESEPYVDEQAMRLWTVILTEIWFELFADAKIPNEKLLNVS